MAMLTGDKRVAKMHRARALRHLSPVQKRSARVTRNSGANRYGWKQIVEPGSSCISWRAGEARKAERQSSRTSHQIASKIEAKTCPDRRKNVQNSTQNRRKVVLGQFRAIKNHSEAAREAPERPRSAKKSPRDRSWEPADGSRTVSETSGERPEGSRDALGTTPGAVRTRPWRRA